MKDVPTKVKSAFTRWGGRRGSVDLDPVWEVDPSSRPLSLNLWTFTGYLIFSYTPHLIIIACRKFNQSGQQAKCSLMLEEPKKAKGRGKGRAAAAAAGEDEDVEIGALDEGEAPPVIQQVWNKVLSSKIACRMGSTCVASSSPCKRYT